MDVQKETVEVQQQQRGSRQRKAELSKAVLVGAVVPLLAPTFLGKLDPGGNRLLLSQGLTGTGEPARWSMVIRVPGIPVWESWLLLRKHSRTSGAEMGGKEGQPMTFRRHMQQPV